MIAAFFVENIDKTLFSDFHGRYKFFGKKVEVHNTIKNTQCFILHRPIIGAEITNTGFEVDLFVLTLVITTLPFMDCLK